MKKILRKNIRLLLDKISNNVIDKNSNKITSSVKNFIKNNNISSLGLYYPIDKEIDLTSLFLIDGLIFYAPKYIKSKNIYEFAICNNAKNNLGKFNIPEPKGDAVNINRIELIIIPGIAFDKSGNRLGRGNGYYDKMLQNYNGIKVGVCHDIQIINRIPKDSFDQSMNYIISEKNFIKIDSSNKKML